MCEDKDSRKRTTRASILAANRAASSSSESEEVSSHTMLTRPQSSSNNHTAQGERWIPKKGAPPPRALLSFCRVLYEDDLGRVSHTMYPSCSSLVGMDYHASCQLFINEMSRMQFHCRCRIGWNASYVNRKE